MSVHPRRCQVATNWPGNFVLDDLYLPLNGTSDIDVATVQGTLKSKLLTATYAAGLLSLTFAPQTIQAGAVVMPGFLLGTSPSLIDVAIEQISAASQLVQVRFRTPAGGAASPPAAATGAALTLAIFRPLPYR